MQQQALASQLHSRYGDRQGGWMAKVVLYTTQSCPYCVQAKALLRHKGVAFDEIDVGGNEELRTYMIEVSGRRTVPQIFINDSPIGGFEELRSLEEQGELDRLLAA
jgi:glutaredoxin 3